MSNKESSPFIPSNSIAASTELTGKIKLDYIVTIPDRVKNELNDFKIMLLGSNLLSTGITGCISFGIALSTGTPHSFLGISAEIIEMLLYILLVVCIAMVVVGANKYHKRQKDNNLEDICDRIALPIEVPEEKIVQLNNSVSQPSVKDDIS